MKTLTKLILSISLVLGLGAQTAEAKTSQFQASLELMGPGILGGFQGSYRPIDNLAVNLGVSYWSFGSDNVETANSGTTSATVSAFFLPLSVSWLSGGKHNIDLAAGLQAYDLSATTTSGLGSRTGKTGTQVAAQLFAGYRMWKREMNSVSFHLRAGVYGTFYSDFFVWPGIAIGAAF